MHYLFKDTFAATPVSSVGKAFQAESKSNITHFCQVVSQFLINQSTVGISHKGHIIKFVSSSESGWLVVENPDANLDVGTLQNFLDYYMKKNPETGIDYVHGENIVERLGRKPGNMGFFLSPMDKNELFRTVILDGALPRKTFSMGEASEKRFYVEARKIR